MRRLRFDFRRRFQWGIRTRLFSMTIVIEGVILLMLGLLATSTYRSEQLKSLDGFLRSEGESIVTLVESWITDALKSKPKTPINKIIVTKSFSLFLENLDERRNNQVKVYKTSFAIYDTNAKFVVQSNNAFPPDVFGVSAADDLATREANYKTLVIDNQPHFRVLTMPARSAKVTWALRIVAVQTSVEEAASRLEFLIYAGIATILLLQSIITLILLERAFRPVSGMIAAIRDFKETDLSKRIPLPTTHDEVQELALTFNGMLNRVDSAFQAQVRLVQDLSHQLKTPLAVIRGFIETGMRRERSVDDYLRIMSACLEETERIENFIITMLELARIESKAIPLNLESLAIGPFLRELVEDLSPLWEQKQLQVVISPSHSEIQILADPMMLRQVFMNLFDNAFKVSPEGGQILITMELERNIAAVEVRNQGPSIPTEDLERIFERFYRGSQRRKPREQLTQGDAVAKGFGLGLSICRSIMSLHQGSIRALNPVDGGAAFLVRIPFA